MSPLVPAHDPVAERDASISWLRVKCLEGTAGLDPYDMSVMIVEVASPDRAWRLELVGRHIHSCSHVRPDHSTCIRVRALLDADVREALDLDDPLLAPVLRDVPLVSRRVASHHDASADILEFDKSRRAGRSRT